MPAHFIREVIIDWDAVSENSYVRDIPAFSCLTSLLLTHPVTFFVGENGSGKSTLLEAMAVAYGLNPEGGSRNYAFSTRDTHSTLHEAVHLMRSFERPWQAWFLRAESFYNVASAAEGYDDLRFGPDKVRLHELSHGEAFLMAIQSDFRENGLYFLDEPEAALSPMRLMTLLSEISFLVKENSQFIIATHSPILMAFPDADMLEFSQDGIKKVNYRETEHYQITKRFLANI
jgi:predicted ATPase